MERCTVGTGGKISGMALAHKLTVSNWKNIKLQERRGEERRGEERRGEERRGEERRGEEREKREERRGEKIGRGGRGKIDLCAVRGSARSARCTRAREGPRGSSRVHEVHESSQGPAEMDGAIYIYLLQ
jgi:hypothetical protein